MTQEKHGHWGRLSVFVNSRQVMDYEGDVLLEIKDNRLAFEPVGLDFFIESLDGPQATLTSLGRRYLANIDVKDNNILMRMTGMESADEMIVTANFESEFQLPCWTEPVSTGF